MRIGVYSGTFDPVHTGHVAFAHAALVDAELDRVMLAPEASPRAKTGVTPLRHRLAMLRLAAADIPELSVIELHAERFTVADTLPELRALYPGATLVLLMGSDVVRGFGAGWPDLVRLLASVELCIGLRGTDTAADIHSVMRAYPDALYRTIEAPHPYAASSSARQGTAAEASSHIPAVVAQYITEQNLYM